MPRLPRSCLIVLAVVAAGALASGAFAADASVQGLDKVNSLSAALDAVERAFRSKGDAAVGSMLTFALKLLAGGYAIMLAWNTLEWLIDGKALPALMGVFLNLTLRFALISAFLVPVGGTSGYSTVIGIINEFANTALSAVGGSGYSTTGGAIGSVLSDILKPAARAIVDMYAAYRANSSSSVLGGLSGIAAALLDIPLILALLLVAIATLVAVGYTILNLCKAFMYAAVAFGLGTALGPMFIALYILPLTNGFLMHWIGFMVIAAFIKVVAAFVVGAVASGIPSIVQGLAPAAAVGELDFMSILYSCFAMILLLFVLGWTIGSIISLANALFPGRVGDGARGGIAGATMAVAGVLAGAAAGAAAKAASIAASKGAATGGVAGATGGVGGGAESGAGGGATGSPPVDSQRSSNVPASAVNSNGTSTISSAVGAAVDPSGKGDSSNKMTGGSVASPGSGPATLTRLAGGVAAALANGGAAGWRASKAGTRVAAAITNAAASGRVAGSVSAGFKAGFGSKVSPSSGDTTLQPAAAQDRDVQRSAGSGTQPDVKPMESSSIALSEAQMASARDRFVSNRLRRANAVWRTQGGGAMSEPMAQRINAEASAKWEAAADPVKQRYARAAVARDAASTAPAAEGTNTPTVRREA